MQKKIQRLDKKIDTKYSVFKDMRKKGHILKTALKFGADFRAYEKGKMPGEEHAKWLVFSEKETGKFSWSEFSAKNRVAHSTKKILLLAIVDEEGDGKGVQKLLKSGLSPDYAVFSEPSGSGNIIIG